MGLLVEGVWQDRWYDTGKSGGAFVRPPTRFRNQVSADGTGLFPAAAGRYHLYVSLACPWAHRTLIARRLKRLDDVISVSIVDPFMGEQGWGFSDAAGAVPDAVNGKRWLHEVYTLADPAYSGRVTVPVLWDKQRRTIVNNESAEIVRILNAAFDAWGDPSADLYPENLRGEIDAVNAWIYDDVNNGVYRAGFATTQEAYEEAFDRLFAALDRIEGILSERRFLTGPRRTEADWRLFTTLVRFDAVYYGHFKCNLRRIEDYPNLSNYLRDLYQVPGIADTVNFEQIKRHYYASHQMINPTRIVPKGPALDYTRPHDRNRLGEAA
ncbi:glutathione S-transferase family protein [Arenibaculum pallidiluteum]|uniref:glutathione S-transferase family protein n=1 Tax=Arenibaculum pallidiluteum TaxID=2812559 RepID=UPI001A96B5BA|nr:glutathione S-transferase family protein [Arenibaculum pallidiluteum]